MRILRRKTLKETFEKIEIQALVGQAMASADLSYSDQVLGAVTNRVYFKHLRKPVSPMVDDYIEAYDTRSDAIFNLGDNIGTIYGESWNRIKAALEAEYNPIENYDRKELTITDHTGTDTDTFGQQINTQGQQTNISGQREDTVGAQSHTQGQQETTYGNTSKTYGVKETEYGATSKTYGQEQTQYGAKVTSNISVTDTDQNDVSAFNVNTYQPNEKNTHVAGPTETTEGSHTDTKSSHTDTEVAHTDTEKAHTDTETSHTDTVGARTDNDGARTDVKGQQSDTIGSRQDTIGQKIDEHEKDTTDSTDSYIHGNVGVTTNQQMIEAEMRLRSMYKLWDIVANDITNEITLHVYT